MSAIEERTSIKLPLATELAQDKEKLRKFTQTDAKKNKIVLISAESQFRKNPLK